MTLTEALLKAPAIGATAPAAHCTARYSFVPTLPIVEAMLERGWTINNVHQNGHDDPFAMHCVTFGLPAFTGDSRRLLGEVRPTAHIYNSHDCSRRISWAVGLEVCVCNNQLHMPVDGVGEQLTRFHLLGHTAGFTPAILFDSAAESHMGLATQVANMRQRTLRDSERLDLAQDALALLRGAVSRDFVPRGEAEWLLHAQRESQRDARDLWTTYNVVQENAIERGKRGGVHEIRRNASLNQQLWRSATALLN